MDIEAETAAKLSKFGTFIVWISRFDCAYKSIQSKVDISSLTSLSNITVTRRKQIGATPPPSTTYYFAVDIQVTGIYYNLLCYFVF